MHRFDGSEDVYTYDTYSTTGFTSQNAWGRLAAVTFQGQPDPNNGTVGTSFAYMYSYTAAGLVTAKRLRLTRGTPTADLEADYTWDTEGRMTSVTYPTTGQYPNYIAGPTYSYGYNSMGQLNTMSQTAGPRYNPGNLALPLTMVSGANYGAAGELLSITGGGSSGYMGETRSYNSLFQVLTISAPQFDGPGVQVQYTYLNGTNIGKIDTQKILVNNGGVQSQEEVQYRYDALGRMISAETTAASQGTVWGYSYGYDGYGNLGSKVVTKGTPSAGFGVGSDAANHLIGYSYDGNGNMTGQGSYSYDAENRLIQYGESEKYGYDPSNKRIQKQFADGAEEIHFYGAAGEHLGVYALNANGYPSGIFFTVQTLNLYFGGKRLGRVSQSGFTSFVGLDRLGSEGPSNLYPWGEEKQTSAQQNTERFATYYRDQGSGLDYADQRYYSSIMARFLTPDPSSNNWDPSNPQSWNDYVYTNNDPVNATDPDGLDCNDVKLNGWSGIANGTTVKSFLSQNNNLSIFAETIFTETRIAADSDAANEKAAVASVIMNRWEFVNGYWQLFNRSVRLLGSGKVRVSDWGKADGTIGSIVYSGQFQVWDSPGKLSTSAKRNLDAATSSDPFSANCESLLQSIATAAGFWADRDNHHLYSDESTGLIFTGFQSPASPGASVSKSYYEQWIGSYGSANVFSGVSASQVWPAGVPLPKAPRRPTGPTQ